MSDNLSLSDFSESDIRQLTISTWLYASAACLLFFDYIVTLPREVEVIWKGRFSLPAFLYYLIRYLPLVWASLSLSTSTASAGPTDTSCTGLVRLLQSISDLTLVIFSVFTALRIYAIWNNNYFLFAVLFILGCFEPAANIFFSVHDELILSAPMPLPACISFLDAKASNQVYNNIPLASSGVKVGYEMLVLVLTLMKTFSIWKGSRVLGKHMSFSGLIVRDGSIYFLTIATVSLLDVILREIKSSSAFQGVASIYMPVLAPILYSRFILDLRRGQNYQATASNMDEVSSVQFHRTHANFGQGSEWAGDLEHTFGEESSSESETGNLWEDERTIEVKNTGIEEVRMVDLTLSGSERTQQVV